MISPKFDNVRGLIAIQVGKLAYMINPPERYGWEEGQPLPDGAKWLACGHPTTDRSENHPSIVHPPNTGKPQEWGYCWWGDGWQDVRSATLTLLKGGKEDDVRKQETPPSPRGA